MGEQQPKRRVAAALQELDRGCQFRRPEILPVVRGGLAAVARRSASAT
ncbi:MULTISPECIES: hypothetical protein [unclassified Streptomyces]